LEQEGATGTKCKVAGDKGNRGLKREKKREDLVSERWMDTEEYG